MWFLLRCLLLCIVFIHDEYGFGLNVCFPNKSSSSQSRYNENCSKMFFFA